MLFGSHWTFGFVVKLVLSLLCAVPWFIMLVADNRHGIEGMRQKAAGAHTEQWRPLWLTMH